jgi:hypothetical protein
MERPRCELCPWFCPLTDDEAGYCVNGTCGKMLKDMDMSTAFRGFFCEDHPMFKEWKKFYIKMLKRQNR